MPQQAVIEDNEFLKMITKGHASAYTISAFMKEQQQEAATETDEKQKQKVISYKNVAERMLRLARDGLIEEAERSLHGRKDYKLTIKGIEQLIFSDVIHKEDVKTIADYMDKYYYDSDGGHHAIGYGLMIRFADASSLLSEYLEYIKHPELKPINRNKYDDLLTSLRDIERHERHPKPKPKPKLTTISLEDTIKMSDSAAAKAAHALRVSVPTSTKKKS